MNGKILIQREKKENSKSDRDVSQDAMRVIMDRFSPVLHFPLVVSPAGEPHASQLGAIPIFANQPQACAAT
jgi:hypothetical protein